MERAYDPRFDFVSAARPAERHCDHPGCSGEGLYRAPKSAYRLRDYHWFCLEHVREYNKAWNFCQGMSEAEIEALIRRDTAWDRPTQPAFRWFQHEQRLHAAAAAFAAGEDAHGWEERAKKRQPETPEAAALRVLGLAPPVGYAAIRARYIALVKEHHPDANGGDKAAEERLKTINQALQVLKAAYLA